MQQKLIGLLILSILFIPIERLWSLRKEQKVFRDGWKNDLIHFFVNNYVVQIGLLFTIVPIIILMNRFMINESFQVAVAAQPRWAQIIEGFLIVDLIGYWAHRMLHEVPALWKFHSIHHSIGEMDWLASARLHPFDQIFIRTLQFSPLFILGFTRETFGILLVFTSLVAIFIHCNTRLTFGPLRWLIATPEFHHWHHSGDPGTYNKNYALFPVMDLMFGTLHLPKNQFPESYGVPDIIPNHYFKQMTYPFQRPPKSSSVGYFS